MEVHHHYQQLDQEAGVIAYVAKRLRHTLSRQLSSKEKRGIHTLFSDGDARHAEECPLQSTTPDRTFTSGKLNNTNSSPAIR